MGGDHAVQAVGRFTGSDDHSKLAWQHRRRLGAAHDVVHGDVHFREVGEIHQPAGQSIARNESGDLPIPEDDVLFDVNAEHTRQQDVVDVVEHELKQRDTTVSPATVLVSTMLAIRAREEFRSYEAIPANIGVLRLGGDAPLIARARYQLQFDLPFRKLMRRSCCASIRSSAQVCPKRGLASPDDGDALALTFAYPVAKRDWAEERRFEDALQKLKRWVV
jgi:hypothetical protein